MSTQFGRRLTGVLPYALAAFILFFIAGVLLVTALQAMGVTSPIFTAASGTALPLACGALAFLAFIGPSMTADLKESSDKSFGRRLIAVLPYSLAAFILFFIGGEVLVTAIIACGSTAPIFTAAGGTALPLACGALAFLGFIGPTMTEDAKALENVQKPVISTSTT